MEKFVFGYEGKDLYQEQLSTYGLELDIYYNMDFLQHEAEMAGGNAEIFLLKDKDAIFLYPYIKKTLPEYLGNYQDITSPYGYCGPFCNDPHFFSLAESSLLDHLSSNQIVTEFVRYHYLYNKEQFFQQNIKNIHNRTIILLDGNSTWETIWMEQFSSTNRNLVRKLEKDGYCFEQVDYLQHIDGFIEMYHQTMSNAAASDYYYFDKKYFDSLHNRLTDHVTMYRVYKEDITYSYALFFEQSGFLTYFLSARNVLYSKVPASNLLLSKVSELAIEKGVTCINFGGGLTNEPTDPLFKFKSNFSKQMTAFHIGKRIHLPHAYEEIGKKYVERHGQEAFDRSRHILQYYWN
ncbi:acetyltransferase (GNAT) family protein [Chitinophaga dinghuensis]|uniref:Acetyltransferase (GNAT) family protein n=1 Tax=Chitinophaga dinghuensis TaxID=1539050 RepID=A0A327W844_9BACT|nr:peptidoglycan bridge formation glycyltransferase FemA/FemB family protein [Chitinophaga dinghuensis]RAJ85804.1 acetyltransferase (GNAT) family protein [Chitinophaga dinghuensis]